MKYLFFLFSFFVFYNSYSQTEIRLNGGNVILEQEFDLLDIYSKSDEIFDNKYYRYLSFKEIPDFSIRQKINELGIVFIDYIPDNTYYVSISKNLTESVLINNGISSVNKIPYDQKLDYSIKNKDFPVWSIDGDLVKIVVDFYDGVNFEKAVSLISNNYNVYFNNKNYSKIFIQIDINRINELSEYSFISSVQVIPPTPKPEN